MPCIANTMRCCRDNEMVRQYSNEERTLFLLAKQMGRPWNSSVQPAACASSIGIKPRKHLVLLKTGSLSALSVTADRIVLLIPSAPMTMSAASDVPSEKWRMLRSAFDWDASMRTQRLLNWAIPGGRCLTRASRYAGLVMLSMGRPAQYD